MTTALPIRSLNHVGRLTKHLEESKAFYRDVLGFQEILRPNFDFQGAWLFNYGLQIHLIVNESVPDPSGPIQTRDGHLAFEVDDLATVEKRLEERGIPFRKNTVAQTGREQIFFRDPDGHHIEVGIYAPSQPVA
ncbi:MAG TPA: VOC family protein [Pirellulales bacterium]|jgi:catechol 2,3-dioxygenase-like lactoylglutathione lyase family enzyme